MITREQLQSRLPLRDWTSKAVGTLLAAQSVMWKYTRMERSTNVLFVIEYCHIQTKGKTNNIDMTTTYKILGYKLPTYIFASLYRFRLLTYCADSSGSSTIVFPDVEIRKIIDKSVFDIHAEYLQVT